MNVCKNIIISIIIPMFNAEDHIHQCIDSIINQIYPYFEVIIIDDGSTDKTFQYCNEYASKDNRIKVVKQKNEGVSQARNKGLSIVNGDWITFVDSDDYLEPGYLSNFIEFVSSFSEYDSIDFVLSGFMKKTGQKNEKIIQNKNKVLSKTEHKDIQKSIFDYKKRVNGIDVTSLGFVFGKFYRSSLVNNIRFDSNVHIREDSLFVFDCLSNSSLAVCSDNVGYNYVIRIGSSCNTYRPNYSNEVKYYLKTVKNKNLDNNSFYQCGLFMYMMWLKLYVFNHKKKDLKSYIVDSFREDAWIECFNNVNIKSLSMPYKILTFFYKHKLVNGIVLLFKLNKCLKKNDFS